MLHSRHFRSIIARVLEKRLFPIYFLFSFLFFNKRVVQLYMLSRSTGYQGIDLDKLKKRKKSDTLYILGSGGSINDISIEAWKQIKCSDSLGLNFWIVNDHIPDFYMLEIPVYKENREVMLKWVDNRKAQVLEKESCILIKDLESGLLDLSYYPEELKGNSYILYKDSLYFCRGSLFSAIYLGSKLGYKKIVLAGVDLYNSGYFYDSDAYSHKLLPVSEQVGDVHDTVNKAISNVSMDELVVLLDQELLKPQGCELYVLNSSSLLHPRIPLYDPAALKKEKYSSLFSKAHKADVEVNR